MDWVCSKHPSPRRISSFAKLGISNSLSHRMYYSPESLPQQTWNCYHHHWYAWAEEDLTLRSLVYSYSSFWVYPFHRKKYLHSHRCHKTRSSQESSSAALANLIYHSHTSLTFEHNRTAKEKCATTKHNRLKLWKICSVSSPKLANSSVVTTQQTQKHSILSVYNRGKEDPTLQKTRSPQTIHLQSEWSEDSDSS